MSSFGNKSYTIIKKGLIVHKIEWSFYLSNQKKPALLMPNFLRQTTYNNRINNFISGIVLFIMSELCHAYRISDENGSRNIHQKNKYEHSEECVRGPDGKGKSSLF